MDDRRTEQYWSRFPDTYDNNQQCVVGKELLDRITEELDGLPELGEVIELGCGTGRFTPMIAGKCENMFATDLSGSLLLAARKRLNDLPNVTVQKEDCMETSFPSEAFDTVFMANLIHVVDSPNGVLRESFRILRNGGAIIIVTFTGHGMKLWDKIKMGLRFLRAWGKPPRHTHSFSLEDLTSMMKEVGFGIKTSKLIGDRTKALYVIGSKD
ncbi:MAG: class I SAM-dependent methyltransferase [Phycisphaerales bacterium]|nr:MAG: class I SAM-dependent methyltransferase [Phycisphaerales bacterium]